LFTEASDGTPIAGWFDFDDAGPGFLAYDLATLLWQFLGHRRSASMDDTSRPLWSAFTTGYSRVRASPLVDMEAGLFVPIRHILWVGNFASRIPLTGARVLSSDWFRNELELVRKWDGLTVH
jgi:Ser/Thr protein kinase RdoA (MazF antagonist)